MRFHLPRLSIRGIQTALFGTLALTVGSFRAAAQTSIYNASFDANGNLQASGTAFTLNPFYVTGVYTVGTAVTVFMEDGSGAYGRMFSTTAFSGGAPTVGAQYTASVVTGTYGAFEEFGTPTNVAPTGLLTAVTPIATTIDQVQEYNNTYGASPSSGTYNALMFAPITFTITPTTSGTLPANTYAALTDATTGDKVEFYKCTGGATYTAGVTYTVYNGFLAPYSSPYGEIEGAVTLVPQAIPEPRTGGALALGCAALAGTLASRRRARGV